MSQLYLNGYAGIKNSIISNQESGVHRKGSRGSPMLPRDYLPSIDMHGH